MNESSVSRTAHPPLNVCQYSPLFLSPDVGFFESNLYLFVIQVDDFWQRLLLALWTVTVIIIFRWYELWGCSQVSCVMTLNFSQLFLFFKDNKFHTISHSSHLLCQPTIEVLMKAVWFRLSPSINFEDDEVKFSIFHY